MKRIREVIAKKRGLAQIASAALFCQEAEKIIKEMIGSDQLRVKKYQNQTLFLFIKNPSLAQEVFSCQGEIIQRLKEELKKPIKRLSYRVE